MNRVKELFCRLNFWKIKAILRNRALFPDLRNSVLLKWSEDQFKFSHKSFHDSPSFKELNKTAETVFLINIVRLDFHQEVL